jgi:hypothetical protein
MLTSFRLVTVGSLGYQDLLALAVSGERGAKPDLSIRQLRQQPGRGRGDQENIYSQIGLARF